MGAGAMRERLLVLRPDAATLGVSSLTRVSTTATATTTAAHGYLVGDYVTLAGSTIAGWNATVKLVTVPSTTTFMFTCSGSLTTPATGTITAIYVKNAAGQVVARYRTYATIAAEVMPIRSGERLQMAAVQSDTAYRFKVYADAGLTSSMRLLWTPTWPRGGARKTLTVTGLVPDRNGLMHQLIDASEVSA